MSEPVNNPTERGFYWYYPDNAPAPELVMVSNIGGEIIAASIQTVRPRPVAQCAGEFYGPIQAPEIRLKG